MFEGRKLSYGGLDAAINRVAGGLAATGLGPGDHIAYYAVLKLRATVVTISALSTRRSHRIGRS